MGRDGFLRRAIPILRSPATQSHSLYKEQLNEILLRQPETMLIDCYNVNTLSAIANTRVRRDIRRFHTCRTLFPLYVFV